MPQGQDRLWYLDQSPEIITNCGHTFQRNSLLHWGPRRCFAERDLYTVKLGKIETTDYERLFFGQIDSRGKAAVETYANIKTPSNALHDRFQDLIRYMSVQKLRTPKGFAVLEEGLRAEAKQITPALVANIANLYGAIWAECIWQIATASQSSTKFIISDHPVTVYNRECFPDSKWCTGANDPDIRANGTHTIFPLSSEEVLILTNRSWVRDPYQPATTLRPNPRFLRNTVFNLQEIQIDRVLSEEEVIEINYILKRRSLRYIAAARKEWLYPERHLRCDHWRKLGDGYLLMPDPRHIYGGGEIIIGYKDGRTEAFSEYGHRPWQKGYKDNKRESREWDAMQRFKAEWSAMNGSRYRGIPLDFQMFANRNSESESAELHALYVEMDKKIRRRPGERQRRRALRRSE